MNNRDGGYVYPDKYESNDENGDWALLSSPDMTMRQRYKIDAPIPEQTIDTLFEVYPGDFKQVAQRLAAWAGAYADAMLAEDEAHEQEDGDG